MSEYVTLHAADGHRLSACVARPLAEPAAGLVVVQEVFGVNSHIRSVADGYAKDGFLVVAPALFDRIQPGVELGYDGADLQTAMGFIPKLDPAKALADISAAITEAALGTTPVKRLLRPSCSISASWMRIFPPRKLRESTPRIPRSKSIGMTQGTASIAMRGSYNPSAAHLARERSLQFLRKYLA